MRFIYSLRKMAKVFANSRDPDQTPRAAASDMGLHCLPITLLRVSRQQWVKILYRHVFCRNKIYFVFHTVISHKAMPSNSIYERTAVYPSGQLTMVFLPDSPTLVSDCEWTTRNELEVYVCYLKVLYLF